MKTIKLMMIMLFPCVLMVAGCKPLSPDDKNDRVVSFAVEVDGIPASLDFSSRTDAYGKISPTFITDAAVANVYVKAFQKSTRVHLPHGGTPGAVASLTRDTETHTWEGSLSLVNPSGDVVFLAYAVAADGRHLYSGTYELTDIESDGGNPFTITVEGSEIGTTAAYSVGDWGPGGGWVFYVQNSYTTGSPTSPTYDWRYMEVAPIRWNGLEPPEDTMADWGLETTSVPGLYAGIGRGKGNTSTLVSFAAAQNPVLTGTAAQLCDASNFNAENDWFLPSQYEMQQIRMNLPTYNEEETVVSYRDISLHKYWSSSQNDYAMGILYDFAFDGETLEFPTNNKDGIFRIRPARRF